MIGVLKVPPKFAYAQTLSATYPYIVLPVSAGTGELRDTGVQFSNATKTQHYIRTAFQLYFCRREKYC
jgi:hypothetical protein